MKCIFFGKILAFTRTSWRLHSRRVPWPRVIWWQQMWTEHPHTSHFLVVSQHSFWCHTLTLAQVCCTHVIARIIRKVLSSWYSSTLHSALSHLPPHSPNLHLQLPCGLVRGEIPWAHSRMRSLTPWSTQHFSQVMSPTSSTVFTSQRPLNSSSRSSPATVGPWTRMTWISMTTPSVERSHHCSLRSEKNQAGRRQAYHSPEDSLSSQSLFVGHVRTVRAVDEFHSLISDVRENPSQNEQIRILLERQKEQILADCRAEIHKHEFQADYDRRSIQKLKEVIVSQREEINRALQGDEQLRRDQQLLLNNHWNRIENFVKLVRKISMRWKNWSGFQGSTFESFSRR